jgi:hypothetical protein
MPNPNQPRGCLFYGCITAAVLALAMIIGVFVAYRYADRKLDQFVVDYTSDAPVTLPKSNLSEAEIRAIRSRVDQFTDALDQGRGAQLVLTPDEINALIEHDPEFKQLREKVYVFIEEDRIKSLVSYPLDGLPLKRVSGRYLNGTVTWNLGLQKGVLTLRVSAVEVNETPLPPEFLNLLRSENFADHFMADADSARTIQKLDRIEVKEGKLFLSSRAAAPKEEPAVE